MAEMETKDYGQPSQALKALTLKKKKLGIKDYMALDHPTSDIYTLAFYLYDSIEALPLETAIFWIALAAKDNNFNDIKFGHIGETLDVFGYDEILAYVLGHKDSRKEIKCDKNKIDALIENGEIKVDDFGYIPFIKDDNISKENNINLFDQLNESHTIIYKKPILPFFYIMFEMLDESSSQDGNEEFNEGIICDKKEFDKLLHNNDTTKILTYRLCYEEKNELFSGREFQNVNPSITKSLKSVVKYKAYYSTDQSRENYQHYGGNGVIVAENLFVTARHCLPVAIEYDQDGRIIKKYYPFHFQIYNQNPDLKRFQDAEPLPWIGRARALSKLFKFRVAKINKNSESARMIFAALLPKIQSKLTHKPKKTYRWLNWIEFTTRFNAPDREIGHVPKPFANALDIDPMTYITYCDEIVKNVDNILDIAFVDTTKLIPLGHHSHLKFAEKGEIDYSKVLLIGIGSPHLPSDNYQLVFNNFEKRSFKDFDGLRDIARNNTKCFYKADIIAADSDKIYVTSWTYGGLSGMVYLDGNNPNTIISLHLGLNADTLYIVDDEPNHNKISHKILSKDEREEEEEKGTKAVTVNSALKVENEIIIELFEIAKQRDSRPKYQTKNDVT